jgi:hypothetical protein
VETVFVAIEGDISGLLSSLQEGIDEVKDRLDEMGNEGEKSGKKTAKNAGIAGAAFGLAAGAAGKLLQIVSNLAVAIPQFFANLGRQAVQANAQFETFATQFETLLGSGSLAQERLEELAQFGVETPFELPEVVEASRTLQTFGGTALATGDNLRMIGDIAAGVNQPFQDVAFWIGRMFDALQNGQPFGEASARLQEMGALTGDARRQMEQMQKAGADGAEIFGFFSEQVGGRFAGNMERLSGTFQGVISNLEDFRGNLLRVGGEPFFEEVRQSALDFLTLLNENEGTITAIAVSIGELAAEAVRFVREGLGGVNIGPLLEKLQAFVDLLNRTKRAFQAFVAVSSEFGEAIGPGFRVVLTQLITELELVWNGLKRVDEALVAGAQILAVSAAGWKGLLATLAPIGEVITKIGQSLLALATGNFAQAGQLAGEAMDQIKEGLFDVDGGIKAMEDSIKESADAIDKWTNPVEEATEAVEGLDKAISDAADTIEQKPLLDPAQIEKFGDQLAEAVENRAEQQIKLEQDLAEKTAKIIADGNQKRLDIDKKFNDSLADLAKDSEAKRLKVIQDTRGQLAELEESTDQELSSRRKEFNKDELRETEDHLKEMRRLEEDFLFNLSDAVRDRDARAIVDLQRQFQKESSQREEDFSINQNRQGQDFDAELKAIRENESNRRQELLAAQAKSLDDINKFEEEKRAGLEMRRQEEQQKLEQDLVEKLDRENQNFRERQSALDEAMQKQLESIAKNLADQKDVTEEGAKEILETFDQFFGIGGDIDQLMEDFARKRKIRADITVAFQGKSAPEPVTAAATGPISRPAPGTRTVGGIIPFAEGGTLIADKPTLALFGEAGPEVVQFTPMSELGSPGQSEPRRMIVELTGSAPPGIGSSERDQIAGVLIAALKETGALQ